MATPQFLVLVFKVRILAGQFPVFPGQAVIFESVFQ
jgi:hypothetical protein